MSQLADKIDNQELKTAAKANLEQLLFPSLPVENVSAYMIEKGGVVKSMINEDDDEPYIYSEAIEQISQEITTETEKLSDINNSLKKSF